MDKIKVFICASHLDVETGEIIRETLADCYGFNVFLFKHNLVGSQDFHKEIITHLNNCEIFIPLLSKNLIGSTFCNQEIGFAVNRLVNKQTTIYPISLDKTRTYDLLDHIQAVGCDLNDKYGVLKTTTYFFNILVSHPDFAHFHQRAVECMLDVLKCTKNWKAVSTITHTLSLTQDKISLGETQLNILKQALINNAFLNREESLVSRTRLCRFLLDKYQITVD